MGSKKLLHYHKDVVELKLINWLNYECKKKDETLSHLSIRLGKYKGYFHAQAKKGDFTGTQLVAIGNSIDINPFEPYLHLLNAQARPTKTETTQAQKIAELEEKISALEKERDWLKEVVMRK